MADPIQEVLQAFASGELVVVTDDDDREGEGDLIVAASLCTAEKMAFIIRHTSGIVCAPPITAEDARRLRLDPMVAHDESNHTTAFTVSIDYKPDGGTGISADERAIVFSGRWRTPMPAPTTSRGPATCFPSSSPTAACCCAPAIPRPRSIFASSAACRRSASSAS